MIVPCSQLVSMVIANDDTNHFDAFQFRTVSIEYNRILENTPIFSKLHRIGGKYNTMTRICNLIIVPCNQLVHMVISWRAIRVVRYRVGMALMLRWR
jgi:hypothetical protein